jgi:hypothetical protein
MLTIENYSANSMDCEDEGRLLVTAKFDGHDQVELLNRPGVWRVEVVSELGDGFQLAKLQRSDHQLLLLEETRFQYGSNSDDFEFSIYKNKKCLGYIRKEPEDDTWYATPVGNPKQVLTVAGFSHELYAAEYLEVLAFG